MNTGLFLKSFVAASVADFNKIMHVSLSTSYLKVKTRMSLLYLTKLVATSNLEIGPVSYYFGSVPSHEPSLGCEQQKG